MLFCASLAPCEKASPAAVKNCILRRVALAVGLAPASKRRPRRWIAKPTQKPSSGETNSASSTFITPVSLPAVISS